MLYPEKMNSAVTRQAEERGIPINIQQSPSLSWDSTRCSAPFRPPECLLFHALSSLIRLVLFHASGDLSP